MCFLQGCVPGEAIHAPVVSFSHVNKASLSSLSVLITIYMCEILNKKNNKLQQKENLFSNLIQYHEDYNFVRF